MPTKTVETIQIKRGKEENLPILAEGEFAYTTDTKKLFIGTDSGNKEVISGLRKVSFDENEGVLVIESVD